MHTLNDYLNATPAERPGMLATAAKEAQAMTANMKPPTAHTHRGKPRTPELDGHYEATKTKRTPTHRRDVPAVMPARIHSILHLIGGRNA